MVGAVARASLNAGAICEDGPIGIALARAALAGAVAGAILGAGLCRVVRGKLKVADERMRTGAIANGLGGVGRGPQGVTGAGAVALALSVARALGGLPLAAEALAGSALIAELARAGAVAVAVATTG